MLIYLPDASEEVQNKAFSYACTMLDSKQQLDLIPATAPCHALLGNPVGRPSTYRELRRLQVEEQQRTGYASYDFASVNTNGDVVGIMGYNTQLIAGKVFGYGPWLGQMERVGITFERDMIAIYQEAINNTHETWVSLFRGELNEDRLRSTYREKDGKDGWQRHVISKYELLTCPITVVYTTLSGFQASTRSVILKGNLE